MNYCLFVLPNKLGFIFKLIFLSIEVTRKLNCKYNGSHFPSDLTCTKVTEKEVFFQNNSARQRRHGQNTTPQVEREVSVKGNHTILCQIPEVIETTIINLLRHLM